jgi:hypothetical protein
LGPNQIKRADRRRSSPPTSPRSRPRGSAPAQSPSGLISGAPASIGSLAHWPHAFAPAARHLTGDNASSFRIKPAASSRNFSTSRTVRPAASWMTILAAPSLSAGVRKSSSATTLLNALTKVAAAFESKFLPSNMLCANRSRAVDLGHDAARLRGAGPRWLHCAAHCLTPAHSERCHRQRNSGPHAAFSGYRRTGSPSSRAWRRPP